jgi:hypothetical protein
MSVDLGTGMLGVTMPFSYVALPSSFSSSSSTLDDIGNRTLFVYLERPGPAVHRTKGLCLLSLGSLCAKHY